MQRTVRHSVYVLLMMLLGVCGAAVSVHASALPRGTRATIVIFLASHCPCAEPHRELIKKMLAANTAPAVRFVAVFANHDESDDLIAGFMHDTGWNFSTVRDRDGAIQQRLGAKVTPEAFLLDARGNVAYHGAIDDAEKNLGQILHPYLQTALEQVLRGAPVDPPSTPATGCWIVR